jgi:hypothetical protein
MLKWFEELEIFKEKSCKAAACFDLVIDEYKKAAFQ